MSWYERHFGFHRFFINSNEDVDEGYVLNTEGIGLRLTAMEYWKCSQTGIKLPFTDDQQPDCKFVIAESLPDQGVTVFASVPLVVPTWTRTRDPLHTSTTDTHKASLPVAPQNPRPLPSKGETTTSRPLKASDVTD
ncbi:unnamed protein product [Oncorhynchus mykiss]|uniref:Uncharacterized protein n=1 Tax=Oncorhynchus mykiss TaxID=8022 RepID=A0A060YKC8_ONCMY|nr:unnamed protein product [Oncorhynchus mykiss]